MKDAYEVLHQKEADFARVRKEVESLNIVAHLLVDDEPKSSADQGESNRKPSISATDALARESDSQGTGAPGAGFFNSLKRSR